VIVHALPSPPNPAHLRPNYANLTLDQFRIKYEEERARRQQHILQQQDPFHSITEFATLSSCQRADRFIDALEGNQDPSPHLLLKLLDAWNSVVQPTPPQDNPLLVKVHMVVHAQDLFGSPELPCRTIHEYQARWYKMTTAFYQLQRHLQTQRLWNADAEAKLFSFQSRVDSFLVSLSVVDSTHDLMNAYETVSKYIKTMTKQIYSGQPTDMIIAMAPEQKPKEADIIHNLLMDYAQHHMCVRVGHGQGDARIKECLILQGQRTRCFTPVGPTGSIIEFIEMACTVNPRLKSLSLSKDLEKISKRLSTIIDPKLPEVRVRQDWFGWRDGMFITTRNPRFIRWTDFAELSLLPKTDICASFHDMVFDDVQLRYCMRSGTRLSWMNIREPFEQICQLQEWSRETQIMWYASLGMMTMPKTSSKRRTAPLPKLDVAQWPAGVTCVTRMKEDDLVQDEWYDDDPSCDWLHPFQQHMTILFGIGGTGKTACLQVVASFYGEDDVALFKTHDNGQFVGERIPHSLVLLGFDIGADWRIDPHFLFSIIDGTWIKVDRKFRQALHYCVEQPVMIAMNEWLKMEDPGGALSRRIMAFLFNFVPPTHDPLFVARARENLPQIIIKISYALRYVKKYWFKGYLAMHTHPLYPADMKRTICDFQIHNNPMMAFLQSDYVLLDTAKRTNGYYIDKVTFERYYHAWSVVHRAPGKQTDEQRNNTYRQAGLVVGHASRPAYMSAAEQWYAGLARAFKAKGTPLNNEPWKEIRGRVTAQHAPPQLGIIPYNLTTWIVGVTIPQFEHHCRHAVQQLVVDMEAVQQKEAEQRLEAKRLEDELTDAIDAVDPPPQNGPLIDGHSGGSASASASSSSSSSSSSWHPSHDPSRSVVDHKHVQPPHMSNPLSRSSFPINNSRSTPGTLSIQSIIPPPVSVRSIPPSLSSLLDLGNQLSYY
jgi:hypothetical protein